MHPSRRTFLKRSSALAAGTVVAATLPYGAQAKVSPNEKLTVGLIGCKNMGAQNLKDFLRMPGVVCAAICDIDDEWLNKRAAEVREQTGQNPKLYKDFRKVIERKDIDCIIIGTPDHWHCLPMIYACETGKDVYVEKPLANTLAECDLMLQAARKYQRVVQVGQQQRSATHWFDVISMVQSGKLGKMRRIKIWANFKYGAGRPAVPDEPVPLGVDFDMWLGPAPARTFNPARFHGSWRMFWDYGGGLMTDWGVHLLDMALWAMKISEPPKSTMATGGIFASQGNALETADTQTVLYEFDDFSMSWEHNGGIQSGPWGKNYGIAFIGSNGTLIANREDWLVIPEHDDKTPRMEAIETQPGDTLDHEKHVANFIECIKSRQKPAADIEIGHLAAVFAHLGNLAYRSGEKLLWDSKAKQFRNNPKANELARAHYRAPWVLPKI